LKIELSPGSTPQGDDSDLTSRFAAFMLRSIAELEAITGTLSKTTKLPCHSHGLPAKRCITGSLLRKVPNSVCAQCYAHRGFYVQPRIQHDLERRLLALSHPDFVPAMAALITKREHSGYFRWFDSGDLQEIWHLRQIVQICKLTPQIEHWLATREWKMVENYVGSYGPFPSNLTVRLSATLLDQDPPFALAKSIGVQVSGVSSTGKYTCVAPKQNGHCGSCRACWNKNIINITYKLH
jgi:hypothetical protein